MRSGAHEGLMCPIEKGVSGDWDGSSDAGPELAGRESHRSDGKSAGPDRPLEKGVRGIETSGAGYLRLQIHGGRKGSAHRQGLEQLHNKEKKSDRRVTRASSDAGPEMAGRESPAAMESPQALIAPLERGCPLKKYVWMIREFNKSSSDDRPGPGICGSKYVEDEKAARSVGIWGSAPIQKKESPQTNV